MKWLLILSFTISSSFARCLCTATVEGKFIFEETVGNKISCKDRIMSANLNALENRSICSNKEKSFDVNWSCAEKGQRVNSQKEESFSCEELRGMLYAGQLMEAALYTTHLTSAKAVTPKVADKVTCDNQTPTPDAPEKIILKAKSKEDLKQSLETIAPVKKGLISEIFDSVENGSISLHIHNDNGAGELIGIYGGDDVGNTHGVKFTISKALGESGYNITIDYGSTLHTNFTTGSVEEEWEDEEGNRYATQNFIEENIVKLIIEKEAKGEAFYWKAGGGVQQLNKSNSKGALGVFSALGNQNAWHSAFASAIPGSARNYTNVAQEDDELGGFVDLKLGKRFTTHSSDTSHGFIDGSVSGRATGVEDASFVSAEASMNYDFKLNKDKVARASAGVRSRVYVDGSKTHSPYAKVVVAGKQYEVGFKYEFYSGTVPEYQNALPENFVFREELAAKEDNLWRLYVKYKWK